MRCIIANRTLAMFEHAASEIDTVWWFSGAAYLTPFAFPVSVMIVIPVVLVRPESNRQKYLSTLISREHLSRIKCTLWIEFLLHCVEQRTGNRSFFLLHPGLVVCANTVMMGDGAARCHNGV